jgi:ABC-type multidrug transport system fused ATPase/permease subunit
VIVSCGVQSLKVGLLLAGKKLGFLLGDIELRNVTFRYPARPLVPVFDRFNVHVMPGSTLALVGQSGSGK